MTRWLILAVALLTLGPTPAWADDWADCVQQANPDLAVRACTRIINSGRESGERVAYAHNGRGVAYVSKGDYVRALGDFDKAIQLKPDFADAYATRGVAYGIARIALAAASAAIDVDRRVALVIGNSSYENGLALPNPVNDASDVAAALSKLGFEVLLKTDLDKKGMDRAFAEFAGKVIEADAALFYYSGHAMELGGRNYLMPIDAQLKTEDDARYEMARADDVLEDIRQAKGIKIFVLDSCRDNPLATALKMRSRSGGLTRGLAKIANGDGVLIAYATQSGDVAADGVGRNSPFTTAFLANIAAPNLEIGQLFRKIATEVSKATGGEQVPEFSISGDVPEFYLSALPPDGGGEVATSPPGAPPASLDHTVITAPEAAEIEPVAAESAGGPPKPPRKPARPVRITPKKSQPRAGPLIMTPPAVR